MKVAGSFHADMTENDLKGRVLHLAHQHGWSVYHVPQRHMLNGGGRGYPDLTLARDGRVMWFELKQEKGYLTPEQAAWVSILPYVHVLRPTDWWSGRVAELLA